MGSALKGIRVVDLSRVLGGPFCTQTLADHGADVIKVEPPHGDETRTWGPPFKDGQSAYFTGVNRNKRGIALDFTQAAAREVLFKLMETADVLVHNFKPGALEKWGMGYNDVLSERFPRLVFCHVTGFGETGPLGGLPGYDAVIQAMTGLMSINGAPAGGPTRIGIPIVDLGTGLIACTAILAALLERSSSGRGQALEIPLYDCAISLLHPQAANFLMSGEVPTSSGNGHPNIVPYEMFETCDGTIYLAVGNDRQFAKLCEFLGCPQVADDPRFTNNASRVAHRQELVSILSERVAGFQSEDLETKLLAGGIPAGVVRDVRQALAHPHTRHRNMIEQAGSYEATGIPARLSRTPGTVRLVPPRFAEHTVEVLEFAGYTAGQIASLFEQGAAFGAK